MIIIEKAPGKYIIETDIRWLKTIRIAAISQQILSQLSGNKKEEQIDIDIKMLLTAMNDIIEK